MDGRLRHPKIRVSLPDGSFIILVDMLAKDGSMEEVNRNVFRISPDGSLLWQIETGALEGQREPFTNIYFDDEGELKAYCWNGVEYSLDAGTGSLGKGELIR